jgi:hypothetical protein
LRHLTLRYRTISEYINKVGKSWLQGVAGLNNPVISLEREIERENKR